MLVIKNGRVIDPSQNLDRKAHVVIEGSRIKDIAAKMPATSGQEIDAEGKWVLPGLIDLHVHLREPGQEGRETVASGTRAAAMGGFTTVACMPNTDPPIDTQAGVQFILQRGRVQGVVNVLPVACVTKGRAGEQIAEIGDLVRAGAAALSDDGSPIMSAEVMRRALEYTRMFGKPLLDHAEDRRLSELGYMHEGTVSTTLGLQGIPAEAETVMVARDIQLAGLTGGRLHVCHISAAFSVQLIREAKKKGIAVTCEVTPHHLALTDEACVNFDTFTKMNPPLRSKEHQDALWKGLGDGTIDAIATDHAPHSEIEKDYPFIDAPFGVTGLETAVPVLFTCAAQRKGWTFEKMIPALTSGPAKILGIDKGTLEPGRDADIAIIDPEMEGTFEGKQSFVSKSWNSPFLGMKLKGFPVITIVAGKVVMRDRKLAVRENG